MNIVNLFARIGLKTDQQKAEKFQSSMKNVRTGLIAATAAATGFGVAVQRMMRDAQESARGIEQFGATTGASTEQLQRWRAVADQAAGAGASVASSIESITKNQQQIALGQGDISGFQLLGIDPRQDPFAILEQLRERMKGLAPAMQAQVAEQIGVSRDLVEVLQMSREEFDQLAEGAPVISGAQIDAIESARAAGETLGQTFEWLKSTIAAELSPSFVQLSEQLMAFMRQNREGIIQGVQKGLDLMLSFGEAIVNVARITDRAIRGTIGWQNAIRGLGLALVWFNRALLFSPIGMFMAAIVGLILVMDDLAAYFNDDDLRHSAFGDFMDRFPELEGTVLGFVEKFRDLRTVISGIWSGDMTVADEILESWGRWGDAIEKVVTAVRDFMEITFDTEARTEAATEASREIQQRRQDFTLQQGMDNLRRGFGNIGDVLSGERSLRDLINEGNGGPGTNQGNVNNIDNRRIEVQVNGGDPREVERTFRRVLSETGAQLGAG